MSEISRRHFAFLAVAVVLVVLLGGRALRADAGAGMPAPLPPEAFGASADRGAPAAAGGAKSGATGSGSALAVEPGDDLLVHVAGRVRRPGVYALAAGSRIADALRRAGGARAGADLEGLNLAAKITDGQQVLVARRPPAAAVGAPAGAASSAGAIAGSTQAPGAAASPASVAAEPVNVNSADAAGLEVLNGVGPAIAAAIVEWRTQNGPFKTVDDLALVPGIGPKKLEAMRAQVLT